MKKKTVKRIEKTVLTLGWGLTVYTVISYIEVLFKNLSGKELSPLNLFEVAEFISNLIN